MLTVALFTLVLVPTPASANVVLEVDTFVDSASLSQCTVLPEDCSLRGALVNANSDGETEIETVQLAEGIYNLSLVGDSDTAGSLNILYSVNVVGQGSGATMIDANHIDRAVTIFRGAGGPSERTVSIAGLTVRGGQLCDGTGDSGGHASGGGILANGVVTLSDVVVEDNSSCSEGGGVFSTGVGASLAIEHSRIQNNRSENSGGGGIASSAELTLTDSSVTGNVAPKSSGGGLVVTGPTSLLRSLVANNLARGSGGGIRSGNNAAGSAVTLVNSTVSGNTATYWTSGTPQPFPGNGGGISIQNTALTLTHTTIAGNVAQTHADTGGVGQGGGLQMHSGSLAISNSIIADNVGLNDCIKDPGMAAPSGSGNIVEVDGSCGISVVTTADPGLVPLASNGGPTETQALNNASPAIDAAEDVHCTPTDQRGETRPKGFGCDIGAFERTPAPVTIVDCSDPSLAALTEVPGDLILDPAAVNCESLALPSLTTVGGYVDISANGSLSSLDVPSLTTTGGYVDISANGSLSSLDVPSLTTTGGDVDISANGSLSSLDLPTLTTVEGDVDISGNGAMSTLTAPSLTTTDGYVDISANGSLSSLDLPSLTTTGGDVDISNNGVMASLTAPTLTTVSGDVNVADNISLSDLDLSAIDTVGGSLTTEYAQADIDLSEASVAGQMDVTGDAASSLTTNTAGVATDVTFTDDPGDLDLSIPADAAPEEVPLSVTEADGAASATQPGEDADGSAAVIDPLVAYDVTVGDGTLPTGTSAQVAVTIDVTELDPAAAGALVDALSEGDVTMTVKDEGVGELHRALPLCAAGSPAQGCARLTLYDALGAEITAPGQAKKARVLTDTGHFSTFAMSIVKPPKCPGFAGDPRPQIVGTAASDELIGTPAKEIVCGLGGADKLRGLGGNDLLLGGGGDDVTRGGAGKDRMKGAGGDDRLLGGAARDLAIGGPGKDTCKAEVTKSC